MTEYNHPTSLNWLGEHGHKIDNSAAIYGDHLLFNIQFTNTTFYDFCKFIYVIRPAKESLNRIILQNDYTPKNALRYYTYRLRRICEMAKHTPGAVLLQNKDLANGTGYAPIEEYLDLKEPLTPSYDSFIEEEINDIPPEIYEPGEESYERHLYFLKQLDLKMVKSVNNESVA